LEILKKIIILIKLYIPPMEVNFRNHFIFKNLENKLYAGWAALGRKPRTTTTVHVCGPRMNQNPPVDNDGWMDGW
jgi:hypothetical protein